MRERLSIKVGRFGIWNLVLGIVTMVVGITTGVLLLINGACLLKSKDEVIF